MAKRFLFIAYLAIYLLSCGLSHAGTTQDYAMANRLFAEAKYREALALYQSILSSPSSGLPLGVIYTRTGDCHFQLSEYHDALYAYRAALLKQKRSERPALQYWIGFCCFLLGKGDESVTEFLKIPELYPASGMWVGTAYYWAGRASELAGKKEQATRYYRKAGGKGKSRQERFALKKAEAVK